MDTLYLTEKIRMTKILLIILGVVGLIAFAYFTRLDGYRGRIEQNSNYFLLDRTNLLISLKEYSLIIMGTIILIKI